MKFLCALSGVTPESPVVSKTGYVFEKHLIEKYIETFSKCPVSGEALTKDDLQSVHGAKVAKPRMVAASSIPGMLSLFQSEWDSLMTETFQLRMLLDTTKSQLAHSLYQHDAATRVVARLLKEKEAAMQQIEELKKQLDTMRLLKAEGEPGISDELMKDMQELAKKLLASRKKRQIEGVATVEEIKSFQQVRKFSLHSISSPGVLCCDISKKAGNRIATGGNDSNIIYFDLNTEKTLAKLQGHLKRVNDVKIHPEDDIIISASDDKTIRVWKGYEEGKQFRCAYTIKNHKAEVKAISIHPLNDYFVSSAKEHCWVFYDLDTGRSLQSCRDLSCNYRCLSFHPDGMILGGGGDDGNLHIWDMKGTQLKVSLAGHNGPICSLAFSENGYYLATGSEDGTVRLWDLRKSISFQTLTVEDKSPVRAVNFDNSGQYLAVASSSVSIYNFETRSNLKLAASLTNHTADVTDVCFGADASFLISSSLDRTVCLWQPKESTN